MALSLQECALARRFRIGKIVLLAVPTRYTRHGPPTVAQRASALQTVRAPIALWLRWWQTSGVALSPGCYPAAPPCLLGGAPALHAGHAGRCPTAVRLRRCLAQLLLCEALHPWPPAAARLSRPPDVGQVRAAPVWLILNGHPFILSTPTVHGRGSSYRTGAGGVEACAPGPGHGRHRPLAACASGARTPQWRYSQARRRQRAERAGMPTRRDALQRTMTQKERTG
jgi:hypothetical protein